MPQIKTAIVGTKFRGGAAIKALGDAGQGAVIILQHEPHNAVDPLAVACYVNGEHVGYIPKQINPPVAEALRRGRDASARVDLEAIIDGGEVKAAPKITVFYEAYDA